ncbi:MAG: prepilin-type N-terminal cleavage/methylation domain-containing protein [Nibricoccus sp.]
MKIQRSTKGFTLVEIMIVVVIIDLLAAMAIPAFQKVRRQSYAKSMANDARQVGNALQQIYMSAPAGALADSQAITYSSITGVISCGVNDPTTGRDYLSQLVAQIGKGYTMSANYNSTVAPGAAAFTLLHQRVAPAEVVGSTQSAFAGNQVTTTGSVVSFDTEGKPL